MTERDKTIDITKALGIVMVVFGHTQSSYIQLVYQFHLPLFFFLSGVVFNERKLENPTGFLLGKIKALYWPFIKFELLFLLLHNVITSIGLYSEISNVQLYYSFSDIIKNALLILTMGFGEQLAGPLWFLISSLEIVILFGAIILLLGKLNMTEKSKDIGIILICLCGFYIGCYTDLPRMGSQSLMGMLFFAFGHLFGKHKEKIKFNMFVTIINAVIVFICFQINFVDISKLTITYKSLLIISGLAGIYVTLNISKSLAKRKIALLEYCGKNTIYVLAFHCVSFKLILAMECLIYNLDPVYLGSFPTYEVSDWWCIPFTVSGVIIPLLVKKLVDILVPKIKEIVL